MLPSLVRTQEPPAKETSTQEETVKREEGQFGSSPRAAFESSSDRWSRSRAGGETVLTAFVERGAGSLEMSSRLPARARAVGGEHVVAGKACSCAMAMVIRCRRERRLLVAVGVRAGVRGVTVRLLKQGRDIEGKLKRRKGKLSEQSLGHEVSRSPENEVAYLTGRMPKPGSSYGSAKVSPWGERART